LLIGALVAYVATLPDAFRIERSQRFAPMPHTVFARIERPARVQRWNPFAVADRAPDRFIPAEPGTGAAYEWDSTGGPAKAA
jgi:hypothetical protein